MASTGSVIFKGKSGKEYKFDTYNLDSIWNEVAVIYIVAYEYKNNDGSIKVKPTYIGQTDNLKDRFSSHHKQGCFDNEGANTLCLIIENNEQTRLDAETDLINNYTTPCND